ncbi:MAG: transposase, partial [FCB group bacterium]|nr:transposase [FCB group bacterium]
MAAYEALFETLMPHLPDVNKARIRFLSKLVTALIVSNTISYEYLARKIETRAKLSSVYRSIQRFFASFEIDAFTVARLMVSLVPIGQHGWILTLDRTNWKFGKTNINFLVLGVAYQGVAIPLFWTLLDKRGNSNWKERIDIVSQFVECFGTDVIECFTADREFIGHNWLHYLKSEDIPICIRTKANIQITDRNGVLKPGNRLFSHLGAGEHSILEQRQTMGLVFDIVGCRLPTGEYLIL